MFVNFTNHPSNNWDKKQIQESLKYGEIVDVMFPNVSTDAIEKDIENLANIYVEEILKYNPKAVLVQGEMCLTFVVVNKLLALDVIVLCACSCRVSQEFEENGIIKKQSEFKFEKYRAYRKGV